MTIIPNKTIVKTKATDIGALYLTSPFEAFNQQ